jgi:hypothetical protein
MEPGRVTREWLEGLDPAEFQEISYLISDIQRERAEARKQKRERRRTAAREKAQNRRYLELERVKCGKKGCKKCSHGELHGPYWYLYRPKENGPGRTSEYVGKVLPETLAEEFDIPEDRRTAN